MKGKKVKRCHPFLYIISNTTTSVIRNSPEREGTWLKQVLRSNVVDNNQGSGISFINLWKYLRDMLWMCVSDA